MRGLRRIALVAALVAATLAPAALAGLPGEITSKAPWAPEWTHLRERLAAIGLPALQQEGLVLHIHQHLDIWVNGRQVEVPAGIGFGVQPDGKTVTFISDLHTHRPDGILHVESPKKQVFTLGQFFDVWGLRFTATCIGGHCNSGKSVLRVWANGKPVTGDPRKLPLTSHEEIVVVYGTGKQTPAKIPASFKFDPGL